jgi:hypothetical protein
MTDYTQLQYFNQLKYGAQVVKTAQALPNNTTASLYTVSTGNVMITSLFGVLTGAMTAASVTLALGVTTSAATTTTSIATATAMGTLPTGTWVTTQVSSGLGGALVAGSKSSTPVFKSTEFAAPVGTLTWTTSANPGATAAMTWYLSYVPLDVGAYVS